MGDRRTYHCRFVRSGRVRAAGDTPSNIEITPQALQTACETGLINGKAVFIDHATLWEYPLLENLVGVTQHSTWNETDQSIIKLYSTPSGLSIAAGSLLTTPLTNSSPKTPRPTSTSPLSSTPNGKRNSGPEYFKVST